LDRKTERLYMKNLITIIALMLLSACGTMVNGDPGRFKNETQIVQELGKPQSLMVASDGTKIYTYATATGMGHAKATSFTINKDGNVVNYTWTEL
jgi:hypothetical protein